MHEQTHVRDGLDLLQTMNLVGPSWVDTLSHSFSLFAPVSAAIAFTRFERLSLLFSVKTLSLFLIIKYITFD